MVAVMAVEVVVIEARCYFDCVASLERFLAARTAFCVQKRLDFCMGFNYLKRFASDIIAKEEKDI